MKNILTNEQIYLLYFSIPKEERVKITTKYAMKKYTHNNREKINEKSKMAYKNNPNKKQLLEKERGRKAYHRTAKEFRNILKDF